MNDTIYFSYFKKAAKMPNAVSIASWTMPVFKGERVSALAPTFDIRKKWKATQNVEDYIAEYLEHLYFEIDFKKEVDKLLGKVALCYCKPSEFCHRQILAKHIQIEFGYKVIELDGWVTPFKIKFEDIDKFAIMRYKNVDITGRYLDYRDELLSDIVG